MPSATEPVSHPPSKANLKAWWAQFTSNQRRKDANHKDGTPLLSLLSRHSRPPPRTPRLRQASSGKPLLCKCPNINLRFQRPSVCLGVYSCRRRQVVSVSSRPLRPQLSRPCKRALSEGERYDILAHISLSRRLILAKPPKSRAHFESTALISECENCRRPSKHLPESVSLSFCYRKRLTT